MCSKKYYEETSDSSLLDPDVSTIATPRVGVLLVNLGTPNTATAADIRRYLGEFLSDQRVVELPPALWQIILRGFVLPFRPRKLVNKYQSIWMEQGSPLLVYSQAQADGLQQQLEGRGHSIPVRLAMRYGQPAMHQVLNELTALGCERILMVPLYPQYAASTTATAVDELNRYLQKRRNQPETRFVKSYCQHPGYIQPLVQSILRQWQTGPKPQRLLLSFHGVPRRTIEAGDPYYRECMLTAAAVREALVDQDVPVFSSFQSRFGAERWLEPYTEPTLRQWAKEGVESVHVVCPGFLADCLETLEEIQQECRDAFLEEGGKDFAYIPCLNDDADWVQGLCDIVLQNLSGWDLGKVTN